MAEPDCKNRTLWTGDNLEFMRRCEDAAFKLIVTFPPYNLGKSSFVAHDLFVKHLSFYVSDLIDVGIEILPMKGMKQQMSSGVPYYERDLVNVIRQGRGVPAVPLVLIGVKP